MVYKSFVLGLFCISSVLGLYTSDGDVVLLNSKNFNKVLSDSGIWLIEFYAPWCGHCKQLAPTWSRVGTLLKGVVKVGAVDADAEQSLAQQYGIQGFPTIFVFGEDKTKPKVYTGGRTAEEIKDEALRAVTQLLDARVGGKSKRKTSGGSGSKGPVELTDSNFRETVMNSKEPWFVLFFAPWCGHCKQVKPHWEEAAKKLKGVVNVGSLDATVHSSTSSKYQISSYPTIKFFPAGDKENPIPYEGGRTAEDFVNWAMIKAESSIPAPELKELLSDADIKEACEAHTICVISFLPQLYDCQTDCRNKYLKNVRDEIEQFKGRKWGWLWTQALNFPELEETLQVGGFGYPAMVAMSGKKLQATTMRGPFTSTGIRDFLYSLSIRGAPLRPVQSLPKLSPQQAWDGKDAPPIVEEDDFMEPSKEDL